MHLLFIYIGTSYIHFYIFLIIYYGAKILFAYEFLYCSDIILINGLWLNND